MPARYFSIDEANALIPEIEPLMARLLERRAGVISKRHELAEMLRSGAGPGGVLLDLGGRLASGVTRDFIAIERLIRKIRAYGCVLKDLNAGLIDFLSERDGREVYLCWRYGESRIDYYHELHTGFSGRMHV